MIKGKSISARKAVSKDLPARTYATHGIDSYPAKMVPHLAHYALRETSACGDLVCDPFCGCGTVMVEAMIMGRRSVGLDVNPVATILSRAKSRIYDIEAFAEVVDETIAMGKEWGGDDIEIPDWLRYWFSPATLGKLWSLQRAVGRQGEGCARTHFALLQACLVLIVRRCSRADPRSPKPFISKRARRERIGKHYDAFEIFRAVAEELGRASSEFSEHVARPVLAPRIWLRDARRGMPTALAGKVDAVITSPPYLSAQDYYRSSKLELAVAGLWYPGIEKELGRRIIGSGRGGGNRKENERMPDCPAELARLHRRDRRASRLVQNYLSDMRRVLEGIRAGLKDGGRLCMIVGDSTLSGLRLPVHQWLSESARKIGFAMYRHEIDTIKDRRVPPSRVGHESVIEREHLLFFHKRPV